MRSAGVISGAVRFTDAEPAIGVPVELYREYFYRGRHGYSKAGRAVSDDRGAYRIYGLAPGNYYLVAAYAPPDRARACGSSSIRVRTGSPWRKRASSRRTSPPRRP